MNKYKIVRLVDSAYTYNVYKHLFLFFWKRIDVISTNRRYDLDEALLLAYNSVKTSTISFEA